MSGVQHGTRLQQLQQLRARLDQEIAAERRTTVLLSSVLQTTVPGSPSPGDGGRPAAGAGGEAPQQPGTPEVDDNTPVLVPLGHVARKAIRAWSGGDPSRHGSLPTSTISAYAAAHHPATTTGAPT